MAVPTLNDSGYQTIVAPRNGLPFLWEGQGDVPDYTRFASYYFRFMLQGCVENISNTPPVFPLGTSDIGTAYIIGTSPTGVWSGYNNFIAIWGNSPFSLVEDNPQWIFFAPRESQLIFVENASYNAFRRYNGTAWVAGPA